MTDLEKRAHDIAVSILPHALKEDPSFSYYSPKKDNPNSLELNSFDITDEYQLLYEAVLKDLQEMFGS